VAELHQEKIILKNGMGRPFRMVARPSAGAPGAGLAGIYECGPYPPMLHCVRLSFFTYPQRSQSPP
jgi:hypothetical protein